MPERRLEESRIVPSPPPEAPEDALRLDVWGFRDTTFRVNERGQVELSGNRYPLSGLELPELLSWMSRTLAVELPPGDLNRSDYPTAIPPARPDHGFRQEVAKFLREDQICDEGPIRLRHGHGHTQEEMYAIKHGALERIPDLVVYPADETQVSAIVEAAIRHGACLIPYGGGTNVTDALRCPGDDRRTIVSVDLARMNRILWIDPANRMAKIQAGAVGRHLAAQLAERGFTLGHEPDSVELSTLGGWIATLASGMKKNRYGNIEDIVLDVSVVTGRGRIERISAPPRESIGVDAGRWILGSEGNLGIITDAVVKLFPLPEVQRYGSIVFPSFEDGFAFLYDLASESRAPASVRLVDNAQFRFSQALKPAASGWGAAKSRLERWYVTELRGFDADAMAACTLVFEGSRDEVRAEQSAVYRIARRHGGLRGGSENGRRGYQLTFSIAYIRDFAMEHFILGESFETSVPWSLALALCENVTRRVRDEHAKRGLPGQPFLTYRVTQLYQTGVCIYFYFAYYYKGVNDPSGVYAELERAARDEILRSGGSLSHHHGIGKLRRHFMPQVLSPETLRWARETKNAIDPHNVFGVANTYPRGGA